MGSLDVLDDETGTLTSVVAQPKRVALLVYLAVARPSGFHRRDTLLALFWPELADARARDALSQALKFLRQGLGADVFVRRGEEVGVDPARVWCDAVAFRDAIAADRPNDAMVLYSGDFLAGFFAGDAQGFEEWLEREREQLRHQAGRASRQLAEQHATSGAVTDAIDWGRRSLDLMPDERGLRWLLDVYARAGDRAGGLQLYDAFARRMKADFDWVAAPETRVMLERLRATSPPVHVSSNGAAAPQLPLTAASNELASIRRAFSWYGLAFGAAAALTWIAMIVLGLPDWALPGILIVMGAGLPVVAVTAAARYSIHRESDVAATTTEAWARRLARPLSWRRVALGGALAVAAFATTIAVYMALRALGVGPPGTLVSAGSLPERPLLVIADFTIRSADSALAGPASDAVRISLASSRVVRLLDRADVSDVLRRMRRPVSTPIDADVAREIAIREGAAAVVDGDVTGYSGRFIITLRLLNAATGALLAGPFRTTTSDFVQGVDDAARQLRRKIGEPIKSVRASPPLARLTTPSLEALQLFSEATRADGARSRVQMFRRAVEIDSTFGTAWRALAIAMATGGFPQASVDTAITKAYQLRDRLSDRERYFAEAMYFSIGPHRDRRRALDAWADTRRAGDLGFGPINNMGMAYKSRRDWPRAESLFRAALVAEAGHDSQPPPFAPLNNILVPLLARGDIVAVESVTAVMRNAYPDDYVARVHTLRVGYMRGRIADYERALDSLRRSAPGGRGPVTTRANAYAAQLRGKLARAAMLWGELASLDSAMRVRHVPLADSLRAVSFDAWHRVRHAQALARLDAALALYPLRTLAPVEQPHATVAILYAIAGRPDKARAALSLLTDSGDTVLIARKQWLVHAALAEIALAENRPRDAIVEFRRADALSDGPVDDDPLRVLANLGRAFDQANEPDSAVSYFEQYVETPYFFRIGGKTPTNPEAFDVYEPTDAVFLAGIYRRLAELHEARGDRARAAGYYRRFIELWKDADSELQPFVSDARNRLARLPSGAR